MHTKSSSKPFVTLLLSLTCAGATFLGVAYARKRASMPPPSPVSLETTADLGHIAEGVVVEQTVILHNNRSTPLRVARVESSCGCTTLAAPDSLPAHGKAALIVHFDSKHKEGDIRQWIVVRFQDPEVPSMEIPVTGRVTREIALSRPVLDLGTAPRTEAPTTLSITRIDGRPLLLRGVDAPLSLYVRQSASQRKQNTVQLAVSVTKPGLPGEHNEKITLQLNHPIQPRVIVPVSWVMPNLYSLEPSVVNFGIVTPSAPLTKTIRISGARFAHPRVLSLPNGWTARVSVVGTTSVDLTLNGAVKGGLLHSEVMVATGNPAQQRIVIPLFAATEIAADKACRIQP